MLRPFTLACILVRGIGATVDAPTDALQDSCHASGGTLIAVSLAVEVVAVGDARHGGKAANHAGDGLAACVPEVCSTLQGESCRVVRRQLLQRLLEREGGAEVAGGGGASEAAAAARAGPSAPTASSAAAPRAAAGGGGEEEGGLQPWFLEGLHAEPSAADRVVYAALHVPAGRGGLGAASPSRARPPEQLRVAVLGTHGPLAALAVDHLTEAAAATGLEVSLALYGQCYLCVELKACGDLHVPSLADRGCDWFHEAPEMSTKAVEEEVRAAANDVVARERGRLAGMVCFGLLLCHFAIAALSASVWRAQIFCMNPLQGAPAGLARALLADVEHRWSAGEAVFTTNAVTSDLLAYHFGGVIQQPEGRVPGRPAILPAPQVLALLPRDVHETGLRAGSWSAANRQVLLARNFLLLHDPVCVAFEDALRHTWPHGVNNHPTRWSFADERQVKDILQHRAVVFLPEHPYKNVFNDFYTIGLPVFVPSLAFLARLWPQVRHVDREDIYDGWFERHIPPIRLRSRAASRAGGGAHLPPAPFDLSKDGEAKVLHWMRLADFYHFPGVHAFAGLASLVERLASADLEAARAAMQRHYESRRASAASTFRALLARTEALREPASQPSSSSTAPAPQEAPVRTEAADAAPEKQKGERDRLPPFAACLGPGRGWPVQLPEGRAEIVRWTVRLPARARWPRALRLQVWRPIRVGWAQGERSSTFQLVGENRFVLQGSSPTAGSVRHLAVPEGQRVVAKPGDVLAWAQSEPRGFPRTGGAAVEGDELAAEGGGREEAPRLCVGRRAGGGCRWWPRRRVCSFEEVAAPRAPASLEAELQPSLGAAASRRLGLPSAGGPGLLSLVFELSWHEGVFAAWYLEFAGAVFVGRASPTSWTFLVCPPPTMPKGDELYAWQKVKSVFGVTVGASLRCIEDMDPRLALKAARAFLQEIDPYGPWLVLAWDDDVAVEAAEAIIQQNPSGLGLVLRAVGPPMPGGGDLRCSSPVGSFAASRPACLLPIEPGSQWHHERLKRLLHASRAQELDTDSRVWTIFVFSCMACTNIGAGVDPREVLNLHLNQVNEAVGLRELKRSASEVLRLDRVWPALNLAEQLDTKTTYEEFMTMRQRLPPDNLEIFEDKIMLRKELLQRLGVKHTPEYYMSNEDPHIREHIAGRDSYVVKPTHMTEGEHIAVVRGGRHVFDVRVDGKPARLAGEPVDEELLQQRILDAWNKTAYAWECQAVVAARPGVIVERLVLASTDPGRPDVQRVEEARCHVVWGRTMAVEWAVGRQGSMVVTDQVDRVGRHSMGTDGMWAVHLGEDSFADPDAWAALVQDECLPKILKAAERVASGARVDHLRVDFLIEGRCDEVYVSELELFPAVPFEPKTMAAIEQRWRYGYGYGES